MQYGEGGKCPIKLSLLKLIIVLFGSKSEKNAISGHSDLCALLNEKEKKSLFKASSEEMERSHLTTNHHLSVSRPAKVFHRKEEKRRTTMRQ